jgi:hypothetical protein
MLEVITAMMAYEIPPQRLLLFEAGGEAYLVLCQENFALEVLKTAALQDSEAAFAMVANFAPRG